MAVWTWLSWLWKALLRARLPFLVLSVNGCGKQSSRFVGVLPFVVKADFSARI